MPKGKKKTAPKKKIQLFGGTTTKTKTKKRNRSSNNVQEPNESPPVKKQKTVPIIPWEDLRKTTEWKDVMITANVDKVAYNDTNGVLKVYTRIQSTNTFVTLVATKDNATHLRDRFEENECYTICGGQIQVWLAEKTMVLSAHTQIKKCSKNRNVPDPDFRKKTNIVTSFPTLEKMSAEQANLHHIIGWILKVGRLERFSPTKERAVMQVQDTEGNILNVSLWDEADILKAQSRLKKNCTFALSKFAIYRKGNTLTVNNSGPLWCNVKFDAKRKNTEPQRNLSIVDMEKAAQTAPLILIKEVVQTLYNGCANPQQWRKLIGVRFARIDRVFQFTDADNQRMSALLENEFILTTGEVREFDPATDTVKYFLRILVEDTTTSKGIWMSGFEKCGAYLFDQTAASMYSANPDMDFEELTTAVQDYTFDVLISGYQNPKTNKFSWTIEAVVNRWSEDNVASE